MGEGKEVPAMVSEASRVWLAGSVQNEERGGREGGGEVDTGGDS